MPVLAFSLPQYFLASVASGNIRNMSATAGSASTATKVSWGATNTNPSTIFPENNIAPDGVTATDFINTPQNKGWVMADPASGSPWRLAAGTVTVVIRHGRDSTVLHGDKRCALRIRVARVNSSFVHQADLNAIDASATSITITTTQTDTTVNITVPQTDFNGGDRLYFEAHIGGVNVLDTLATIATFYTGNQCRVTALPQYTIFRETAFSASGVATPTWRGAGRGAGVFAATGLAASDWRQTNIFSGIFTAAGAATAQVVATNIFSGVFSAAGQATPLWRATAIFSGVFGATGQATPAWVGASKGAGIFTAAGAMTSDWKMSAVAGTVFAANGVATTLFRATNIFSGVFTAAGIGTTQARATAIFSGVFAATGSAAVVVRATAIFSGIFDADGAATTDYRGSSVSGAVFNGAGQATTDVKASKVLGTVFDVDIGSGGAAEYPDGLLRLNAQGQIESVSGTSGIPSNALRLVEELP